MFIKRGSSFLFFLFFLTTPLFGAFTLIQGKWSDERYAPKFSVQEHYDLACSNLLEEAYAPALNDFLTIIYHFYESPFYSDSLYYAGVCYFNLKEYDLADRNFSLYLGLSGQLRYFEKVFEYKYLIAEAYRKGAFRHIFGVEKLPKILPSRGSALALYDEAIVAMPGNELAAKALYGKSKLLRKKREYQESIDALKTLTRRFPKHPLGAKAFILISKIYLEESRLESQNPDYLALAQLNIEKMKKSFPGDTQVEIAEKNLLEMQEVYSRSLFETGRFYERKKKFHAASIYYNDAIARYPLTQSAKNAEEKLIGINEYFHKWRNYRQKKSEKS